jgi:hypothetical protein
MKEVIHAPDFYQTTGTVFMELSSDKQPELDRFFSNQEIDSEILLNIFREVVIGGWYDRGMYEFIQELWKLNKSLPKEKKIRMVAIDIPRPFNQLKDEEEYDHFFDTLKDRNEVMADIVEQSIKNAPDQRNSLFIVGLLHAFKSSVPALKENAQLIPKPAAGAQLSERFSKMDLILKILM